MTGRLFGERNYKNCNKWQRWGCNLFLHVKEWSNDSDPFLPDAAYGKLSSPMPSRTPTTLSDLTRLSLSDHVTIGNQSNKKLDLFFHHIGCFGLTRFRFLEFRLIRVCKLKMWYTSDKANWKQWYSCLKGNSL